MAPDLYLRPRARAAPTYLFSSSVAGTASTSTPATALLAGSTVAISIGSAGSAVAVATGSRESEAAVAESAAASGTRALSSGREAGWKSTYGVASKLGVSDWRRSASACRGEDIDDIRCDAGAAFAATPTTTRARPRSSLAV